MRISCICIAILAIVFTFDHSFAATSGRRPGQVTPVITDKNNNDKLKSKFVQHPAFVNAGKKPGLEIWRIENFQPVAYPQNDYGKFYTGDSYIVLNTREKNGVFNWDLHFWLGRETSQDESGAAAALTVQLDDQLGGTPVQYREVQEQESQIFKSHFKKGISYVPGGVASGFRHVDNTVLKKLYIVKGKRNIRVKQVEMSVASMNKGDCFILDNGNDVYVYVGPNSKRVEKLKAISVANSIRDIDHSGRSKITVIDEFATEDESQKFFDALGSGSSKQIPDDTSGGDDEQFERNEGNNVALYKVSDSDGKLKATKITQKPLKQEMLDTNDCFVLDTEHADLYVWVGRKCNAKEKAEAMTQAQNLKDSKKYPSWTRVQRIVENAEPEIFREYFFTWRGTGELHSRLIRSAAKYLRAYHAKSVNGKLDVHHIDSFDQDDLDEDDVIIIDTGSDVFVWYGKHADDEERALSLSKAEKIVKSNNNESSLHGELRTVEQGKESNDFISLFSNWNANKNEIKQQ